MVQLIIKASAVIYDCVIRHQGTHSYTVMGDSASAASCWEARMKRILRLFVEIMSRGMGVSRPNDPMDAVPQKGSCIC